MKGIWYYLLIAPGSDHVSGLIEHDNRRRLFRCLRFRGGNIAAVNDHDVIVRIGTYSPESTGDPTLRQRFGPRWIHLVMWHRLCD